MFPYLAGLQFVRHFFLEGDWATIDEVYLDPPVSTEQIIHPERYPEDVPVELALPELEDVSASGWRVADEGQLGEWLILSMLSQYIFPEDADRAAEGWGGDTYQILVNEESGETAFVLLLEWDTMRDSHEFTSEFRDYGNERFGDAKKYTVSSAVWEFEGGVSQMERVSNQTLWVIAPSAESLELIWDSIRLPLRAVP